jgi:hypothetical protein
MANCGNCSTELKFGNTPILGGGKLASGETICLNCFRKLIKLDMTANSKKFTLDEVKAKLSSVQQTANRIQDQLQKIGLTTSSALWGRKEIAELPAIIPEGEEIFGLVQGVYNGGQGILVATDRRLLFVDKGLLYGLKVEDFGLDKLTSIQIETGLIFADIKIMASGNIAKISNVDKTGGRAFCEKVRAKLSEPKQTAAPVTVVQQQVDVADQLGKLAALKDQGILTQEEFDTQKKKLLGL